MNDEHYNDFRSGVGCGFLIGVLLSMAVTLVGMVAQGLL